MHDIKRTRRSRWTGWVPTSTGTRLHRNMHERAIHPSIHRSIDPSIHRSIDRRRHYVKQHFSSLFCNENSNTPRGGGYSLTGYDSIYGSDFGILVDTKVSRDGSKDWSAFCLLHAMRCDATGVLDATRRDGGGCFVCVHTDSRRCSFVRSVSVRTKDDESSRVD